MATCAGKLCCGASCAVPPPTGVQALVRERYGAAAAASSALSSSDSSAFSRIAQSFGYAAEDLIEGSNLGLGCGNPTATAKLRAGEVVVDLGSGGGLDIFLAAEKVGPTGKAIGVDMTEEMVDLARRNAAKRGLQNAEFHLASIAELPLADGSVDCIISNCVLNLVLSEEKQKVVNEMHRVLKPGGRVAISDILAKGDVPEDVRQDAASWIGCVAGTVEVRFMEEMLRKAGFEDISILPTGADLNIWRSTEQSSKLACCNRGNEEDVGKTPERARGGVSAHLKKYDLNEFVGAYHVYALKHI